MLEVDAHRASHGYIPTPPAFRAVRQFWPSIGALCRAHGLTEHRKGKVSVGARQRHALPPAGRDGQKNTGRPLRLLLLY